MARKKSLNHKIQHNEYENRSTNVSKRSTKTARKCDGNSEKAPMCNIEKEKAAYSPAWILVALLAPFVINLILTSLCVSLTDILSIVANGVGILTFLGIGVIHKRRHRKSFPAAFYGCLVIGFVFSYAFWSHFSIVPIQQSVEASSPAATMSSAFQTLPMPTQTPTPEPSLVPEQSIPDITYPTSSSLDIPLFQPKGAPEDLTQMINGDLRVLVPPTPSNNGHTDFSPALFDAIKAMVATDVQPDRNLVNGSSEFVELTAEANDLETSEDSDANHMDRNRCEKIISLREDAYRLFPIKDLRIMLSENYHLLARFSRNEGKYQKAYEEYKKAIEYCIYYVKILPAAEGEDFFRAIYKLGILYQCIGDIPGLDQTFQMQAYSLSAGFLELSLNHWAGTSKTVKAFDSTYYCAMANHKLLIAMWETNKKDCSQYIINAHVFYVEALELAGTDRVYINQALAEICNYGQVYTSKFEKPNGMLTYAEYRQSKESFINNARGTSRSVG